MEEKKLAARVKEAEVVRICRDLVRLQTVNPPGNEMAAAEYVAADLKKGGVGAELVKHSDTRSSVLARLKGCGRAPAVFFNGHLDTVPVGEEKWLHDPFGGDLAEGNIWGRGSADMKGGLAAMMAAAKVLAEARVPLRGDLILAATAGEEVDSLGAAEVGKRLRGEPMQALFIAEPTGNEIFIAEKGVFWLGIETFGQTAHGSMPDLGRNAVLMMVKFIAEFEKLNLPFSPHPILGGFTRSVNTISGGVKTNVVPDHCGITIDMRTVPGQEHTAILGQVKKIIGDLAGKEPGFKSAVKVINDHPAVETSPEEPVLQEFASIVSEMTGQKAEFKGANYFSDAVGFLPHLQAPLVLFGPGDPGQAHQPNERVEIPKLVEAARIYAAAAEKLLV